MDLYHPQLIPWSLARTLKGSRGRVVWKARLAGVPVVCVDPRNRACPACGHVAKANRPTPAEFRCVGCGFAGPADAIAAENIRRAARMRPYAAGQPS